jgi:hypothetical protein
MQLILSNPSPVTIYVDGDVKKKTASKTVSGNVGASVSIPHGAILQTGFTIGKGKNTENTTGHWEVQFCELSPRDRPLHLMDNNYAFVGGGRWGYTPNTEDFGHVNGATFLGPVSPSGVFRMKEQNPAKVEFKAIAIWETQQTMHWGDFLRKKTGFVNVICALSTVVEVQKAPNKEISILFDEGYEASLSEDPKHFKPTEWILEYENIEVPMISSIVGTMRKIDYQDVGQLLSGGDAPQHTAPPLNPPSTPTTPNSPLPVSASAVTPRQLEHLPAFPAGSP